MKKILISYSLLLIFQVSTYAQSLEGIKNIVNKNSGLCLAVRGASMERKELTTQWTCDGQADKNWELIYLGADVYKIQNSNSNMYLSIGNDGTSAGSRMIQNNDYGFQDVNWQFIPVENGYYKIKSLHSGLFLAVAEGSMGGGADIIQWQDIGQEDLKWQLQPAASNQENFTSWSKTKYEVLKPADVSKTATKTVEVRLNGIFMGECGNPNDCTHEPVAGEVHIYLIDKTTGAKIVSTNSAYTLWNSNHNYNLICNKYRPATGYGSGSGDGFATPESVADNIEATLYYTVDQNLLKSNQYEFVVRFNLGSPHKDNDFASTGYHWLKEGKDKVEAKMDLPTKGTTKRRKLGPYETQSNRCHEYQLQFDMKVY